MNTLAETTKGTVYKTVIVGDGGVGKTSLIKKFVYNKYDDKYIKTLGTNVYKKVMSGTNDPSMSNVNLQIWDVLGQKSFTAIIRSAFKGAKGVFLVCDVTDKKTLDGLKTWMDYAYEYAGETAIVVLGNKTDLPDHEFGLAEMKDFTRLYNVPFFLTSAKFGTNVDNAFEGMVRSIRSGKSKLPKREEGSSLEEIKRSPIIAAEDELIDAFCRQVGNAEVSMPVIRQKFKKLDIDFENPTKEDLQKMVKELTNYVKFLIGDEEARKVERNLNRIVLSRDL